MEDPLVLTVATVVATSSVLLLANYYCCAAPLLPSAISRICNRMRQTTMTPQLPQPKLPQFNDLGEDLIIHILSFLADGPLEKRPKGNASGKSTMTNVLPLVCKDFQRIVKETDQLWAQALIRQIRRNRSACRLWRFGFVGLLSRLEENATTITSRTSEEDVPQTGGDEPNNAAVGQDGVENDALQEEVEQRPNNNEEGHREQSNLRIDFPIEQDPEEDSDDRIASTLSLLERLHEEQQHSYQTIYRRVLNEVLRFKGPVFYMRARTLIGQPYVLHFFEPRYRLLIADVMRPYDDQAKRGGPIQFGNTTRLPPPLFIHATSPPLICGTPAMLVQVIRCYINELDGRADVALLPVAHIRLEKVWTPPNSHGLFYAQGVLTTQEQIREWREQARRPNFTLLRDW